ncbi:lysosome membrane protein 2-like isoform X3 [Mobula birostris]|uniref:lysosome membrane protein 2-like isoform X3 n=1 Tax=Mobula birostris TaxID=1983395 RepID=UPI003B28145E
MTHLRNKVAVMSAFALGCLITFIVLTVNDVLKNVVEDHIKEHTKLKLNSEAYKNWKDPPVPVYMQIFFFHIENPEEILKGNQPMVREVGPYTYMELRHRSNVLLFDNATISAATQKSFIFQPAMSVGDPRVDVITTINIPFVLNGTDDGEYLFSTGKKDYMDFSKILTWKGQKSLNWWASNTSNMINGTDGATFHPLIKKDEALYIFAPDICRSLYLTFEKEVQVKGISAYRFTIPKEIFAIDNLSIEGFCPAMNCHLSGVLNISVCKQGVPIFISSPHFYNGDEKLVSDIVGMKPDMEAHQTFLDLEPMTGIPIRAAKRMQLNIHIQAVDYIFQTGRIRTMLLPVVFLNEHAVIDDKSAVKLKWALHIIKVVFYIPYIILWVGILLFLISLTLIFVMCRCKENKEYTPVALKLPNIKTH